MSSILTGNHFELFKLPEQYALDQAVLDARYRELQRAAHPDRYASASDRERRISMQQATHINEAYQVLKDPLARARYLLELRGHAVDDRQSSGQDPAFLMQQMELRESLAEIRQQDDPLQALDRLAEEIRSQYQGLVTALGQALDGDAEPQQAVKLVMRMQFFTRLREELQALEADLEDELY